MSVRKQPDGSYLLRWLEGSKVRQADGSYALSRPDGGKSGVYRQMRLRGDVSTPEARKRLAKQAEDKLKELEGDAAARRPSRAMTFRAKFRDLAERYMETHGPTVSENWRKMVRQRLDSYLIPAFGSLVAEDLRPGDVIRYRNARLAAKAANATVNREVTLLRSILNFAEAEEWIARTPLPGRRVKPLPEKRLEAFFTVEEWQALRSAFDDEARWRGYRSKLRRLGPIVVDNAKGTARRHGGGRRSDSEATEEYRARLRKALDVLEAVLLTGSRVGEIIGLTWEAVDLTRGVLRIGQPKTGNAKTIPISTGLAELLKRQPRGVGKAPVFARPGGGAWDRSKVEKAYRIARKLATKSATNPNGMRPELRIHDLRHTAASWATMAGIPERIVREYLGHQHVSMTARYSHLQPTTLAPMGEVLSRLSGRQSDASGDA